MIPVSVKAGKNVTKILIKAGEKLIDQLRAHGVKLNDACEGNLGCGTCHIIFDEKTFKKLPQNTDQEEDLLLFSPGLTKTSRLACGIKVDSTLNDAFITIPELNRNVLSENDLVTK
ncbi:2Fe-2S ferredoxin 1 [Spironucleus salmonicida]|uniref:2Fe-2S ferredoxin 1 n=1 Tax=Spironucleus salmonicida TaxID=348837 RepID=K7R8L1_9EUKA|nr:2Fe-2S ferredoxin 1 [Spironucleus salmonicida]KAH0577120.1 2Fe-2S ferredoxin 1 [Spironucleus salmonicida]|eukprot:EST45619.1 [2Fe-2S] Ferredoxin 1 [Spironucleus salmonicida]